MTKVYITNNTLHDFTLAEKYGELVDVTKGKAPIFKTDVMKEIVYKALESFKDDDYLLISGPAIISVISFDVLRRKGHDTIKCLIFDAKLQNYVVRHI